MEVSYLGQTMFQRTSHVLLLILIVTLFSCSDVLELSLVPKTSGLLIHEFLFHLGQSTPEFTRNRSTELASTHVGTGKMENYSHTQSHHMAVINGLISLESYTFLITSLVQLHAKLFLLIFHLWMSRV